MKLLYTSTKPEHEGIFYLLGAVSTLVIAVTVGLQPLFLDEILAISFERSGTINAHLLVMTQMGGLLVAAYLGDMGSSIKTSTIGPAFLVAALGAFLAPFSGAFGMAIGFGGLFFYYLSRIVIASGTEMAQWQIVVFSGDRPAKARKLFMAVLFMMAFGALPVCGILMQIPKTPMHLLLVMLIPAIAALASAAMIHNVSRRATNPDANQQPAPLVVSQVIETVTQDPRLQLVLATAFFVRADFLALSLFLSLWCISFADLLGLTRGDAVAHAGLMLATMGTALLATMAFWQRMAARHGSISALGAGLSLSAMGFFLLARVNDPFSNIAFLPLLLLGVGQSGCLVAAKTLTTALAPPAFLGRIQGLFQFVGGIGIILLVQSGGYYFDAVGPQSPFVLLGSGHLFIMMYAFWMLIHHVDEHSTYAKMKNQHSDLKPLIFMFSLLPVIWLAGRILIGGFSPGDSLGQMPVGFINRYLGDWAFNFLLISLAIRPLSHIFNIRPLRRYGRMIGLYGFFYALLHVLTYIWMEWVFQWDDILADTQKRSFILLGVVAFLILCVLAVTSTRDMQRRMGGKLWKKVHRVVYLVNLLVVLHFLFAATHDNGEPYVYGTLVLLLLGYRLKNDQWLQTIKPAAVKIR